MSRRPFLRRLSAPALVLLLLPALPGCLIPYGLPELSQTPLLSLGGGAGEVHAFHRGALAGRFTSNGAPGERPQYGRGYYAAFALDPDGNNIESVCHNR